MKICGNCDARLDTGEICDCEKGPSLKELRKRERYIREHLVYLRNSLKYYADSDNETLPKYGCRQSFDDLNDKISTFMVLLGETDRAIKEAAKI